MKAYVKLTVLSILITFCTIGSLAVAANNKVLICHVPPGNSQNFHTIYISERAVRAHLNHGDMEGTCSDFCADLCDDNNPCTEDLCDGIRGCDNIMLTDCDDGIDCTDDYCDDGIYCNGNEVCEEGECKEGNPPDCDDGIGCTDDYCVPDLDACQNVPDDNACDNDLSCDGEEICDSVSGCLSGEEHCPAGMECDEDTLDCVAMKRFTDNGDGTVTDNQIKMIWLKNGNCFGRRTWNQSVSDYTELADGACGLNDASRSGDWRLPTREEWEAFVCGECLNSAMFNAEGIGLWSEEEPFSSVQSYYWSGSEYDLYNAWYMDMINGSVYMIDKSVPLYVWPVREETNWVIGVRSN